ncbi:MAG TPA: Ku protein [Acidimicrobiia bacterium]|nr:Ku protein [Acidimicrobiia bacterium]
MPQAIWTGSISFGLVTVPVRLVSATKSQDVRFNQLEATTGSRIRYRRVSEQTGEEVPNDQIVKGYELENGHYVVLDNDELSALKPSATRMIEIEDFVDLSEIDPVYFEQPYYLVPDKDAAKAYRLLSRVMEDENKVAVGRFVLRSKEALVAIRPIDGMLCLETMRYADEVLAPERELVDSQPEPSERELEMARQLVDTLSGTFDPEKYHDEYREEVLALIERKAAGEEIVAPATPEEPAKVLDLMAALEASLARTGAKQPAGSATAPERAATKTAATKTAATKRTAKKAAAKKAPAKRAAAKKATGAAKRTRKSA